MPHCAVVSCTNQSRNVNKQKSGISYHKFPSDPSLKDKWILATGKFNWFPQNHDTICSKHFEAECFRKRSVRTYLSPYAVPTLKLHPLFDEIDPPIDIDNDTFMAAPAVSQITAEDLDLAGEVIEAEMAKNDFSQLCPQVQSEVCTPDFPESPPTRKLKLLYERARETIKRQRLLVKRLRESNRRLSKKIDKMKGL